MENQTHTQQTPVGQFKIPTKKVQAKRVDKVAASPISAPLSEDQLKDLYRDMREAMKDMKAKKQKAPPSFFRSNWNTVSARTKDFLHVALPKTVRPLTHLGSTGNAFLVLGLGFCFAAKLWLDYAVYPEDVSASSTEQAQAPDVPNKEEASVVYDLYKIDKKVDKADKSADKRGDKSATALMNFQPEVQKQLLAELDRRRVELERKSQALEERERDLDELSEQLTNRTAQLSGLVEKVQQVRKSDDVQEDKRFEQLSEVYGSMPPKDAAPLIEQLDESIALKLLDHMSGKRMGQILSLMSQKRAVELTRKLSKKVAG